MKGYVYKIWSSQTDDIYIGSTKQKYLCWRFAEHKKYMRNNRFCSSAEILKYEDAKIECLEVVEFNDVVELRAKEGEWIRKSKCVNKVIPCRKRTKQEWRKDNPEKVKQHRENQKEYMKEYRKKYYEENKEHLQQQQKEYNEKNKEHRQKYFKNYNEKRREKREASGTAQRAD